LTASLNILKRDCSCVAGRGSAAVFKRECSCVHEGVQLSLKLELQLGWGLATA
jgi:hypothetical protein